MLDIRLAAAARQDGEIRKGSNQQIDMAKMVEAFDILSKYCSKL
jgi:hypothetical protein